MFCISPVTTQASILIVKDKPEQMEQCLPVLSALGYSVQSTNNIPMLNILVRTTVPRLILINIDLSEIDSIEVYYHLKAERQTSKIPIIFFNNLDNLCDRLKSLLTAHCFR
jgi:CheY-like chemotaxis protein